MSLTCIAIVKQNAGLYRRSFLVLTTALAVAGMGCRSKKAPHFTQLSLQQTGIAFRNNVSDTDSLNIFEYPYLYAGAGVAVGDVNGDGLDDIFLVGNRKGRNKLYLNKGGFRFEDVTARSGVAGRSDWCTGAVMADVNADGRLDIYVSTVTIPGKLRSANELYINEGNGRFSERANAYGLDLSGHGTQAAFFDYDRDGDLDCFLLHHATNYTDDYQSIAVRNKRDKLSGGMLLRNEAPSRLPQGGGVGASLRGLPVGEAAHKVGSLKSEGLWQDTSPLGVTEGYERSSGRGFSDVTATAGIYSASNEYGLGIGIGDLDNDGWPDLYVSNDFKEADFCYINQRDGTFAEVGEKRFDHMSRFSMGNDVADYNNDGWPDVLTLDMLSQDEQVLKTSLADDDIGTYNYKQQNFGFHYQFSKNCLQKNIGGQRFCDVGLQAGVAATDWSWAPLLADFDNDGKKDLFVSNGFRYRTNDLDFTVFSQARLINDSKSGAATDLPSLINYLPDGQVPDYFFLGRGEEGFTDQSEAAGFTQSTLSNGAAYADLDNDGDLDLVVARINAEPGVYRNDFPPANHLSVSLLGSGGNTFGIGATVYAYAGGALQMLYQSPVRGFLSSVSPVLHFGLGKAQTVDSLIVLWPDGSGQKLTDVAANRRLVLKQSEAAANFPRPSLPQAITTGWQAAEGNGGIRFRHREDEFDDLNVQPLLPHSFATQGPRTAVGDANGDGLQDFYVCGAKGQAGALYLQNRSGGFDSTAQRAIAADSLCEDVDALFFDADSDGDNDLYVVSGGGEYFGRQPTLPDRLYTNDGRGNFTKSTGLPDLYENKSCVRAADFDKDGDLDLFVGGRVNARLFGYVPASVILQNNRGVFTEVTAAVSEGLSNTGMVTDACWTDVDRDGWSDLLVVGEWMPVTLFKNNRGQLMKQPLANSSGLWQTALPADADGDGDTDFLLGNWGRNSKLTASEKLPLKLYVADWDSNGETEPVLATAKDGKYYSFFGKADLEKRLPYLRKRFLQVRDFAGKTMEEVFTQPALDKAQLLQAVTLESALLKNENGKLVLEPLPHFLQTAPVLSFAPLPSAKGKASFVAGGNLYEVSPYEGRYDALLPVCFSFQNGKAAMDGCLLQPGPLRKISPLNVAGENALLLSFNNGFLTLYKQRK